MRRRSPLLRAALLAVAGLGGDAVDHLNALFQAWRRDGRQHPSSRQFVVPGP